MFNAWLLITDFFYGNEDGKKLETAKFWKEQAKESRTMFLASQN